MEEWQVMKLHDDWKHLLRKSWTIKWQAAAMLLDAAQMTAPLFSDQFQPGPFAGAVFVIALGGIVARLLAQPKDGL
jgi:hypothetical protein